MLHLLITSASFFPLAQKNAAKMVLKMVKQSLLGVYVTFFADHQRLWYPSKLG